jgi:diaminopropionate ammonia-lyase
MSGSEETRFVLNRSSAAARRKGTGWHSSQPREFHRRLPDYTPTPLIDAPVLARRLGIRQLLVKDESSRLGLPAFKILGASWAVFRLLQTRLGRSLEPWQTIEELTAQFAALRPLTLLTATDGNHGRAVAHVAALFGLASRVFVPAGTAMARIERIASEGADVEVVAGTYDDAVERAAAEADQRSLVVSDTSWPGYEEIPQWVMEGYSTILLEIDEELSRRGEPIPDIFPIQFGVGALAAALVRHYPAPLPKIVGIEPLQAACALASIEAGELVTVPGPHNSIMTGLNCGRASLTAWPIVSAGIDAFLAIPDERAREAMRALASIGITAGETGAAGLAGLIELLSGPRCISYREALHLNEETRAIVLVTEGATDPFSYRQIVGAKSSAA